MAVKVTGLFQNPQTDLIYQNPILGLVPHLEYPGLMNMDVKIFPSGSSDVKGMLGFSNINKDLLTYPAEPPYDALIYALEEYVITNLSGSNTINQQATFEHWNPQA